MKNPLARHHRSQDQLHAQHGDWRNRRCTAYVERPTRRSRTNWMTGGQQCSRRCMPGIPYCWQHRTYQW